MKTIIYHATDGEPIRDGDAMERAKNFLKSEAGWIEVSSEMFILAIRVLIHDRCYPHDQIEITFKSPQGKSMTIPINQDGRLSSWPNGFCDKYCDFLDRLLDAPPDCDNPL